MSKILAAVLCIVMLTSFALAEDWAGIISPMDGALLNSNDDILIEWNPMNEAGVYYINVYRISENGEEYVWGTDRWLNEDISAVIPAGTLASSDYCIKVSAWEGSGAHNDYEMASDRIEISVSAESVSCLHDITYRQDDNQELTYRMLDSNSHEVSYLTVSQSQVCNECGEIVHTEQINEWVSYVEEHFWKHWEITEDNTFVCDCGAKAPFTLPCNHNGWGSSENGSYYCQECGKIVWPDDVSSDNGYIGDTNPEEESTCKHFGERLHGTTNIVPDEYKYYNEVYHFVDKTHYYLFVCGDCGITVQNKTGSSHVMEEHTEKECACGYSGYVKYGIVDTKEEVMDYGIDFIAGYADKTNDLYNQFFNDELRKEIEKLANGGLANAYDIIDGDTSAALMPTSQADFYVDTLMKQCAGINGDSTTIRIAPAEFKMICDFIGLEDEWIDQVNKMVEKWSTDRWTDKDGVMILDDIEWAEEMKKFQIKVPLEEIGDGIEIGSYLWNCLYDYYVYSTAFEGEASTMIDSAWNRLQTSDLYAATLASRYINSCESVEGRLAYIMLKNANITDFARDEAFDLLSKTPLASWNLAKKGASFINEMSFSTQDTLDAAHATYWSLQMAEELKDQLDDYVNLYKSAPTEKNYNDCLGAYTLYMTYLISAYNGVMESIDVYSNSNMAKMIGDGLTSDEKALVENWKDFVEMYEADIEYALDNFSIDGIEKWLKETA